MARKKGSKDRFKRAKARSPYKTYSDWYDKYTKGHKAGWFSPKLSEKEFNEMYELAKRAKIANPARSIAASQEYVDRTFEKRYRDLYGEEMGDIRDKKARVKMFEDFVDDMMANGGMTYDQAREEFEKYFY